MRIAYPKSLRTFIANADLCMERGELTQVEYDLAVETALSDHETAFTGANAAFGSFERNHAQRCWEQPVARVALPALPEVRDAKGNRLTVSVDGMITSEGP